MIVSCGSPEALVLAGGMPALQPAVMMQTAGEEVDRFAGANATVRTLHTTALFFACRKFFKQLREFWARVQDFELRLAPRFFD